MICDSTISPHLCISTRGQGSLVCGKLRCRVSSRWWSTAGSIRILTRRGVIFFSNVYVKLRNGSNMVFFRIHRDPLDHWSVKPHTTGLNFSSILTKQCTILSPTHWYLNIPLDQTHPFLKGFYLIGCFTADSLVFCGIWVLERLHTGPLMASKSGGRAFKTC